MFCARLKKKKSTKGLNLTHLIRSLRCITWNWTIKTLFIAFIGLMTNSKIYFKLQDDCHPDKPKKERRVSQDNGQKISPRVDSAPQLSFRPLVALPLAADVISFPFSKLKVLELLLGFVVLFTLALLSTTCMNKKLWFTDWKITERKWQRVGKLQNWKENKSFA